MTILWTERTPVNGTAFYENNGRTDRTTVNGMSGVEETKHGQTDSQSDRHRLLNYGYPRNRASRKQSKDRQTDRTPVNGMSGVV